MKLYLVLEAAILRIYINIRRNKADSKVKALTISGSMKFNRMLTNTENRNKVQMSLINK